MKKLAHWLHGILPLLHNMILPAIITAITLFMFYATDDISLTTRIQNHHFFYILSLFSILLLFYANKNKGMFFLLSLIIAYTLLNRFKYTNPETFVILPEYINLCFLLPFCLIIFYFLPESYLLKRHNVYYLLIIFSTFTLGEQLSFHHIVFNIQNQFQGALPLLGFCFFIIALIIFYSRTVISGSTMDYCLFFAALLCFLAFYHADNMAAPDLFFCSSSMIILCGLTKEIYSQTYTDSLTGFANSHAFKIHAEKFPIKYSVGVIHVDNYNTMKKMFGKSGQRKLLQMMVRRFIETETEATIYRFKEDEFVFIFKDLGKNKSYQRMEDIRRSIAASDFMFKGNKKAIKLTISGSVSEKKRSDATVQEVISRCREALKKTATFSLNVTSQI